MPIYAFHGAILGGISAGGYTVYCYLNGVHNYLHRWKKLIISQEQNNYVVATYY